MNILLAIDSKFILIPWMPLIYYFVVICIIVTYNAFSEELSFTNDLVVE